jgi:major membrane immunogen (membrane-anchored lipoprotein)
MLSRLVLIVSLLMLSACSEEQQNKLTRLGVTWLEGDYRVTYADGEHVKSWIILDGKVTTEPAKGYYYFWEKRNGKKTKGPECLKDDESRYSMTLAP